jgi:hypothetical protein
MALSNTFVYNTATPGASAQFNTILNDKIILLIVIGKSDLCTKIVNEGDLQAAQSPFGVDRHVVWLPDNLVEKALCLKMLKSLSTFDETTYDQVVAFSVKPISDIAADAIYPNELADDITIKLRLKRAFARAGVDFRTDDDDDA